MHWGRKHRHQSFLKKGGGITLVLGAAFAALESDGSVDGSDETDGELDSATFVLDTAQVGTQQRNHQHQAQYWHITNVSKI